jgi:DNA polymerase-3 subunit beta
VTDVTNLEELLGSEDETAVIAIDSTADLAFATKKFVLQAQLEKAAFVLPSKDHIPVLKHFQIEVSDGGLRVMATDLELSVLASTPVIAQERRVGTAMFPGVKFLQLIKEAEDSDIHVDVHEGYAHIECGPTTWNLRLRDGAEYPDLPNVAEVEFHKINRVKFLGGISAVRYAAAHDQTRTNLMMIDFTDGTMVACDGARYQRADLIGKEAREHGESFPLSLQIPIGAVPNLLKLLKTTEGEDILIGETENALVFNIGSDMFVANKMTVSFPDMDTLLLRPAMENHDVLTVDRQELIEAVRRVRITADPETSAIVLSLGPNQLVVRTKDKYGNESAQPINAGWVEEPREVAVNHAYLSDMLEMTDSKSCTFKLGPDTKTKKASLLLEDEETDSIGILSTMRPDWLT